MRTLILLLILCNSCQTQKSIDEDVRISVNKEVLNPGESFVVELSIGHIDSLLPEFYLFVNSDTLLMNFIEEKDCAILEIVKYEPGKYNYEGFVDYFDKESIKQIEHFTINFTVEE